MPNQTGPRTAKDKALTRYNAATHGIYSVTPVLPRVERQACAEPGRSADWLAHRAGVFADLKPRRLPAAVKYTCCMYKNCRTNLMCQVEEASHYRACCSCPGRSRESLGDLIALPGTRKARGNVRRDGHRPVRLPHAMGSRGNRRHPIPSSLTLPLERLPIYREGYSFPSKRSDLPNCDSVSEVRWAGAATC